MLNNKGFTILEVVISFSFVVIILGSMFTIVLNYQEKNENEKVRSDLITFKNQLLEIVYEDIIKNSIERVDTCSDNTEKCFLIVTNSSSFRFEYENIEGKSYINYKGNRYMIPDSQNGLIKVSNFICNFDVLNKVYSVNIPISHYEFTDKENESISIKYVISGKKYTKN